MTICTVKKCALILILMLVHSTSWAAVAFDAVSNGKCNGSGISPECTASLTTLTYSHTTGAGSNRGIAVGVCVSGGSATVQPAISTVTYAGVSLTQKKHQGGNYYCDIWSLPDGTQPTTGANNVVIVVAAGLATAQSTIHSSTITFTGVNQSTAWTSTDGGNSGTGTTATATITSSGANDMGVHFECNGLSVSTTVGTNETSRFVSADDGNGACNSMGSATATGGDTSFSRTVGSDPWLMVGGALKDAGAVTAVIFRRVYAY